MKNQPGDGDIDNFDAARILNVPHYNFRNDTLLGKIDPGNRFGMKNILDSNKKAEGFTLDPEESKKLLKQKEWKDSLVILKPWFNKGIVAVLHPTEQTIITTAKSYFLWKINTFHLKSLSQNQRRKKENLERCLDTSEKITFDAFVACIEELIQLHTLLSHTQFLENTQGYLEEIMVKLLKRLDDKCVLETEGIINLLKTIISVNIPLPRELLRKFVHDIHKTMNQLSIEDINLVLYIGEKYRKDDNDHIYSKVFIKALLEQLIRIVEINTPNPAKRDYPPKTRFDQVAHFDKKIDDLIKAKIKKRGLL